MGADLYKNLQQYWINHLKNVRAVSPPSAPPFPHLLVLNSIVNVCGEQAAEDLSDEALLRYYVKEWERYTNGATYVHRLFTYLNRHWVKREKDEGKKNVYLIYIVGLSPLDTLVEFES
jgi:cullin 1